MLTLCSPSRWPSRRWGERSSQGWPVMARSGQDCEKKQSFSHEPELLPKIAGNGEPLWGFWKGLFFWNIICAKASGLRLVRRVPWLPAKWLGRGLGCWKERALTFPLFCYHVSCLTLSKACEVLLPQFPHLWESISRASPQLVSLRLWSLTWCFTSLVLFHSRWPSLCLERPSWIKAHHASRRCAWHRVTGDCIQGTLSI